MPKQTQINLDLLEARLAMRVEQWIAGKIEDDKFFFKLNNIFILANNKTVLKQLNLQHAFNPDGSTKNITTGQTGFEVGMLQQ